MSDENRLLYTVMEFRVLWALKMATEVAGNTLPDPVYWCTCLVETVSSFTIPYSHINHRGSVAAISFGLLWLKRG